MKHSLAIAALILTIMCLGCKPKQITTSNGHTGGMDAAKAAALHDASALRFAIMSIKGKADFTDLGKGTTIGFTYRIDIAKDSLILINLSKFGVPAMNMLISQDTIKMRIPLNQTAAVCDYSLLQKVMKLDLNFEKFQAVLLGQALLDQPVALTSSKGSTVVLEGNKPPYSVYWNLNAQHFKLEKMRMLDAILGNESVLTYSDFKKVDGQLVAFTFMMEATQSQTVRIELHHSGIEFDKEKINFRFRIPESYKIMPCDSLQQQR